MKPLLLGECYDGECLGLDTPSGGRLRDIMGVEPDDYLEKFVRRNLCEGEWVPSTARLTARRVFVNAMFQTGPSKIVLLGRRVADAFMDALVSLGVTGLQRMELLSGYRCEGAGLEHGVVFVVLPHPNGRSRVWNDAKSVRLVRRLLVEAGVIPVVPVYVPRRRVGRHGK